MEHRRARNGGGATRDGGGAIEEGIAVLRKLQVFFVLGALAVSIPAAADEPSGAPANPATPATPTQTVDPANPANPVDPASPATPTNPATPANTPWYKEWDTFLTGYFRAPLALGISTRPNPDNPSGPHNVQISYGPNRTVDANYYAFTYTRLQEQDWTELFIHEKHKHAEAVIGMMGYWYQSSGFRNPDASWFPGMAYLTLDTDFKALGSKPNIALTMGAFWPKFGYFEKYDTYTLGRFRQLGEQLKLTAPVSPGVTVTATQGFGTVRDGSFSYLAPAYYGSIVGVDLITYENLQLTVGKVLDMSLHYNNEWTSDPNLAQQSTTGPKSYTAVSEAHLSVLGAEVTVSAPIAGRLWVSPSYISVKNGWALNNGGTEVMNALGGAGIATNYMAWANAPASSTGSGSMFNFGFLYENSLSVIQGKPKWSVMPEVTLNVFGLLADASLDLPAGSKVQNSIKELKYGADLTVQALDWLALMGRFDVVNMDLDHPAYIFNAVTARMIFSTHFLSTESIYLQYSRYTYGDKMTLAGTWPWGAPLVAGNNILQGGPYAGWKPDMDVIKLQATVAF
jgi:hypothetical protein